VERRDIRTIEVRNSSFGSWRQGISTYRRIIGSGECDIDRAPGSAGHRAKRQERNRFIVSFQSSNCCAGPVVRGPSTESSPSRPGSTRFQSCALTISTLAIPCATIIVCRLGQGTRNAMICAKFSACAREGRAALATGAGSAINRRRSDRNPKGGDKPVPQSQVARSPDRSILTVIQLSDSEAQGRRIKGHSL
jgi:hypothetical protein